MNNLADYYSRPIEIADGQGCYLYDKNGKKFLDFLAGWCVGNIGWKNQEVKTAVEKEAKRGIYVPPVFHLKEWDEFAELLVKISPNPNLKRVFRCASGSEAVEFAIKCARAASGKPIIVSVDGVYHGHTYGAASVGDACSKAIAPCAPDFLKISMPLRRRATQNLTHPPRREELGHGNNTETVLKELEIILKTGRVAAFLSEPVWTNAGSYIPSKEFYPAVEKLCRKYDAFFIMDEVATGFGRCGALFASELWGVKPDILCLGKGLTGGYGAMGATLVTEEIFKASGNIPHYSTFGWNVLDIAAARANVEFILKEKLWENSAKIGKYLLKELKPLEKSPYVGEVRGIGLLLGIEIVKNKKSLTPDWPRSQKIQDACARAGLIIETAGHNLFLTPPLILTEEIADEGVKILKKVIV